MVTDGPSLLFVYGTLKRGFENHHFVEASRFLGEYLTEPAFDMVQFAGFPGAISGRWSLAGEVYEIDAQTLRKVDRLELRGIVYRRCTASVGGLQAILYMLLPWCETLSTRRSGHIAFDKERNVKNWLP